MRVLLVGDDLRMAQALTRSFARHEIRTSHVFSPQQGMAALNEADLVLLDLALPDIDGLEVCRQIRATRNLPVIIISGRAEVGHRILGLRAGADDYLAKPVDAEELIARMHAARRRLINEVMPGKVFFQDVVVDLCRRSVTVGGTEVRLSRKEFEILALISVNANEVCTREMLALRLWNRPWSAAGNTVAVHISTLRAKIGRPTLIETVRGVGYRLAAAAAVE
ncbi:response regulator transcription factor [Pseudonocardia acaciae]|uniref:response regulator transcription factor n=1 Tax=Pseudonocardia acaciae TaxID=551276 RepID=UPI00048BF703|nr:response regulator transcription factor [Pseudonocardia acaciae]